MELADHLDCIERGAKCRKGRCAMRQRATIVIFFLGSILIIPQGVAAQAPPPTLTRPTSATLPPPPGCPVTLPNRATPPGERPSVVDYGNGAVWTQLWPDGTVVFAPGGPGSLESDGSLGMKWPWWRGILGQLTIQGHRLDAPGAPLRAETAGGRRLDAPVRADVPDGYGTTGFQATSLVFPSPGCWQVTGQVGNRTLMFVTRVVKIGAGPRG